MAGTTAAALALDNIKQAANNQNKRVTAHFDEDTQSIVLSIDKAQLLSLVGPSSGGKGSGAVVDISGDFTFEHEGKEIAFTMSAGWRGAWVSVYRK